MANKDINEYSSSGKKSFSKHLEKKNENLKLKKYLKNAAKIFATCLLVCFVTGTVVFGYIVTYVMSLSDDRITYDMKAKKLHLTSIVYVNDENNVPYEYDRVYNLENRIWVDFNEIPQHMKDAIIAIEDKRFEDHRGVDWFRTVGAVASLFSGKNSFGGSTLTQQLIKNLTDDNEVSLMRKAREIFRAINFEKDYSKDEILEAYLNVVNFGAGCRGVQTAANTYFNKDIKECSIAECAAIAGITQNPSAYNPLVYPENNKKRRETVLREMLDQDKITAQQYKDAMEESSKMLFTNTQDESEKKRSYNPVRNWYMEAMFEDVVNDLSKTLRISKDSAQEILYTQGLKVYSAMDVKAQNIAQEVIKDESIAKVDSDLEIGYMLMGYDGRVLASIGSRKEKEANLVFDRANSAIRQPGSTIKPIASYAPAIDLGLFNYSSVMSDSPIPGFYSDSSAGPNNFGNIYYGDITIQFALETSSNTVSAKVLQALTPRVSYNFMTQKLGFTTLDETDIDTLVGLSIGGLHKGVTVREMTAAFQIFGNGGIYNKPYTYYYVVDRNGKVLLDNRGKIGERAIKSETATIMNRLLRQVIAGPSGTGKTASISGWDVIGKTGTTDKDKDSWFLGATPVAVSGVWAGYDTPRAISQRRYPQLVWKEIMARYIKDKQVFDYQFDANVVEKYYSPSTGNIVDQSYSGAKLGYYSKDNFPQEQADAVDSQMDVPVDSENVKEQDNVISRDITIKKKTKKKVSSLENQTNQERQQEKQKSKRHAQMDNIPDDRIL